MFDQDHLNEILSGLRLLEGGKYWECHEELEDVWLEWSHDPVRNVPWAIIQVSVAIYHYEGENWEGAYGMLKKAREKVAACEEKYVESDLLEAALNWSQFKSFAKGPEQVALGHGFRSCFRLWCIKLSYRFNCE